MKNNLEECWLSDERAKDSKNAPLLCLKCERFKTNKFMRNPESREAEIFLNGFRLALLQLAIQLDKIAPSSEKQMEYIRCLEIQTKCSVDRGVPIATLEEAVRGMMKQAEPFLYR
jgi:hypothetical protein